jgi:hypothetical protein
MTKSTTSPKNKDVKEEKKLILEEKGQQPLPEIKPILSRKS